MCTYDDVYEFLIEELKVKREQLTPDVSLRDRLGVEGDDFFEFEEAYARRFSVDMSAYRWYFHHGEEGFSIGGLLFKPPYDRVDRIPVTPTLLLESANAGRWPLEYPPHELPAVRYDGIVNVGIFLALGVILLFILMGRLAN
jgi:hypothetical protein